MEVIVLVNNWQFDSGECGTRCEGVFTKKEDALKRFNELVKDARTDMNEIDTEETKINDGELESWSIWESGEYCYNHIDIIVSVKEVK